jgi:hypothetical protein
MWYLTKSGRIIRLCLSVSVFVDLSLYAESQLNCHATTRMTAIGFS